MADDWVDLLSGYGNVGVVWVGPVSWGLAFGQLPLCLSLQPK